MLIKLISSNNADSFNKELETIINEMENKNLILANIEYKPLSLSTEPVHNVQYTALLFFTNPYKEQAKLSSILNMGASSNIVL